MRLTGTLLIAALALGCGGEKLEVEEPSSALPGERSTHAIEPSNAQATAAEPGEIDDSPSSESATPRATASPGDNPETSERLWSASWYINPIATLEYRGNRRIDQQELVEFIEYLATGNEFMWRVDEGWRHSNENAPSDFSTPCTKDNTRIIDNNHVAVRVGNGIWCVYGAGDFIFGDSSSAEMKKYVEHLKRLESLVEHLWRLGFEANGEPVRPSRFGQYAHPFGSIHGMSGEKEVTVGYQIDTRQFPKGLKFWFETDMPKGAALPLTANTKDKLAIVVPELVDQMKATFLEAEEFAWKPVEQGEYSPSFESEIFSVETEQGIYYAHVFVNQEADGMGIVTDAFGGVRGAFVPHFLGKRTPLEIDELLFR